VRDGKSRQVCLRRKQEEQWQLAEHYQYQMEKLAELKETCLELQQTVTEIIEKRVQKFP